MGCIAEYRQILMRLSHPPVAKRTAAAPMVGRDSSPPEGANTRQFTPMWWAMKRCAFHCPSLAAVNSELLVTRLVFTKGSW